MYRIIAYDSPTDKAGHVVFDPRVNRYISDGKLNLKESEIDDLSLTVNQANYLFGNVRPLQTHVEVYQDNSLLFRGRALDLTREMKDSGQFVQSFVFENIQNYLQDTSQRWAKVQNTTPKQFFQRLIDTHNSQVHSYKKFTVRTVDVTNSTDNVYRYIEDGATTWDTIKDKLLSRLGGFIRVEYVNGFNYIDYLQNPGKEHNNDTPIRIGKNLQSASVQIDPTEVITQLVPLGATIENDNTSTDSDSQVSQPRIDIKSVNGGKDYLDIPNLQQEFGIIRKSVQWDDVHKPKILLTKAKQWIAKQTAAKESWTVNALELPSLESFKVSDRYLFNNQAVASPQMLRVTSKAIDLLHWQKSTLTIAEKASSLSNYQLENKRSMELQKAQTREAKAQAKRAWDSRLIGDLVETVVPVGTQADETGNMPVYTLKVAEDNPDFGLNKGQNFGIQVPAYGVIGLKEEIDDSIKDKANVEYVESAISAALASQERENTNLLFNGEFRDDQYWSLTGGTTLAVGIGKSVPIAEGRYGRITNTDSDSFSIIQVPNADIVHAVSGNTVTLSVYLRALSDTGNFRVYLKATDSNDEATYFGLDNQSPSSRKWKRYSATAKLPVDIKQLNLTINLQNLKNIDCYATGAMLTVGDVLLPFTESVPQLFNELKKKGTD